MTPEERERWLADNPGWRPPAPGERHRTASALVLDVRRARVLLVGHKLTGWLQVPGGHLEGEEDGAAAALREVREETGVFASLWLPAPLSLAYGTWVPSPWQTFEYPAPADPAWGEPAHRHLDELYLALADSEGPVEAEVDKVDRVLWADLDYLRDPGRARRMRVRDDVPALARLAWREVTRPEAASYREVLEPYAGGPVEAAAALGEPVEAVGPDEHAHEAGGASYTHEHPGGGSTPHEHSVWVTRGEAGGHQPAGLSPDDLSRPSTRGRS